MPMGHRIRIEGDRYMIQRVKLRVLGSAAITYRVDGMSVGKHGKSVSTVGRPLILRFLCYSTKYFARSLVIKMNQIPEWHNLGVNILL